MPHPAGSISAQSLSIRVELVPVRVEPVPVPSRAMTLLAEGVPLSLLMDLADPLGPDSLGILANESNAPCVRVIDLRDQAEVVS